MTRRPATVASGQPEGIWDLLRQKGAPVARCFAMELLKLQHEPEPTPRICEFSSVFGYMRTGYTCAIDNTAFLTEVFDRLDLD